MSTHAIGNGKVCAYIEGTRIDQIFGPGYSSPVALTMETVADPFTITERRALGLWQCQAADGSILVDMADPRRAVFYRSIQAVAPIRLIARACHTDRLFPIPESLGVRGLMSVTYEGTMMYPYEFTNGQAHGYVSGKRRYFGMRLDGEVTYTLTDATTAELTASNGALILAFADTPEALFDLLTTADPSAALASVLAHSEETQARLLSRLTAGQKRYAENVLSVYDAIAAQQAESGGVLAGNNYHLCYIRDNYGVFRGLMAMGAYERARALMEYYIKVFATHGRIHNAQGASEPMFHVHENDAVEITGYLVDMIARTYAHTKDADFARRAEPLATYCISAQHGQLRAGLLPFNGDETYIAGGLLPRTAINDASMEATALYHRSLCQILTMRHTLPGYTGLDYIESDKAAVEAAFAPSFLAEAGLICNRPDGRPTPAFRTGVRFCGHGLGISFCNRNGDYVCADCLERNLPPLCDTYGKVYAIPSAVLCPMFVGTSLIPSSIVEETGKAILRELPHREKLVGYDYGLLLYALRNCEDSDREGIIARMLSLADEHGVWNEYYTNGISSGTPCRPWESAINIAALMEAAQ